MIALTAFHQEMIENRRVEKQKKRHEEISRLAYLKWQAAGCPDAGEAEFWYAAEKEWNAANPPYTGKPGLYNYMPEDLPKEITVNWGNPPTIPLDLPISPVITGVQADLGDKVIMQIPPLPGEIAIEHAFPKEIAIEPPPVVIPAMEKKEKGESHPQSPLPKNPEPVESWIHRFWKRIKGVR